MGSIYQVTNEDVTKVHSCFEHTFTILRFADSLFQIGKSGFICGTFYDSHSSTKNSWLLRTETNGNQRRI